MCNKIFVELMCFFFTELIFRPNWIYILAIGGDCIFGYSANLINDEDNYISNNIFSKDSPVYSSIRWAKKFD